MKTPPKWNDLPLKEQAKVYELLGGVLKSSGFSGGILEKVWWVWVSLHWEDNGNHKSDRWQSKEYLQLQKRGLLGKLGVGKVRVPFSEIDFTKKKPGPKRRSRRLYYTGETRYR
jgi:hypothetical protein